jgi:shikimate dehydrogenase
MKKYGIIGNPLGHSYSERYFKEVFVREEYDAIYTPHPIAEIEQVKPLLKDLEGFNVTYPYKETIIPYLKEIDPVAGEIGAVNVVHQGKGYNTDWIGFRNSIQPLLRDSDTHALLLGTGGVSKAIQYALREMGVKCTLVSRAMNGGKGVMVIGYDDVDEQVMGTHTIVVNCTPLGMHPLENDMPRIKYDLLTNKHLVYDCIYNPERTLFLQEAAKQDCRIMNGLQMLHLQADAAWEIWRTGGAMEIAPEVKGGEGR